MISNLFKIIQESLAKNFNFLIFFVTSKCNCKCKHCFYWKSLRSSYKDMSLAEIRKISKSMDSFNSLLISGGEPFLRLDLPEIIKTFHEQNRIKAVGIPTNGTLTSLTIKQVKKILIENPNLYVEINISLDGLKATHDEIRGLKGCFEKAIKTALQIKKLEKEFPNLKLGINTVLLNTIDTREYMKLANFIKKEINPDKFFLEPIRGNPREPSLKTPELDKFEKLTNLIIDKQTNSNSKYLDLVKLRALYDIQKQVLKRGKMPLTCLAGETIGVIEFDGRVKLCELLGDIGDLRKSNYDFKKVWNSTKANNLRKQIKTGCNCTHCVFLLESMEHNLFYNLIKLPFYRLKNNFNKK